MRRAISSVISAFLIFLGTGYLFSQEDEEPQEKPEKPRETGDTVPYVEFVELKYTSAAAPTKSEGAAPTISLKFNLATEVPKGAKIYFELEYNALSIEESEYTLKDENRRNLVFAWKPKQRLAVGEYYLRTRMTLKDQAPAVQKALKQSEKRFPPKNDPWSVYYPNQVLEVGGAAEEAAEKKAICETYKAFIEKLLDNMTEFKEKTDKVTAGKELVNGSALDVEKFKAFLIEWREKQGKTQKEINDFQIKEPALFQKSITAYANLRELGQMVSKRSFQIQNELTDKYKAERLNPKETHQFFNRNTKYKADADNLNRKVSAIEKLVCPEEADEEPEGSDEAGGDGKKKDGSAPSEGKASDDGKQGKKGSEKGEKKK